MASMQLNTGHQELDGSKTQGSEKARRDSDDRVIKSMHDDSVESLTRVLFDINVPPSDLCDQPTEQSRAAGDVLSDDSQDPETRSGKKREADDESTYCAKDTELGRNDVTCKRLRPSVGDETTHKHATLAHEGTSIRGTSWDSASTTLPTPYTSDTIGPSCDTPLEVRALLASARALSLSVGPLGGEEASSSLDANGDSAQPVTPSTQYATLDNPLIHQGQVGEQDASQPMEEGRDEAQREPDRNELSYARLQDMQDNLTSAMTSLQGAFSPSPTMEAEAIANRKILSAMLNVSEAYLAVFKALSEHGVQQE